jgi:drug/metabolite transporter (DMT)-like permease
MYLSNKRIVVNKNLIPWLAFFAVSIFWGTTYLATRIGVQTFPPFMMAAIRQGLAGFCLLLYFLVKGYAMPSKTDLKSFFFTGIVMLAGGNGIITWGMQYVDSGLTSLICALTPVWIVLFNLILGKKEQINGLTILGFLICLIGQVLIFSNRLSVHQSEHFWTGIVAIVLSNLLWAIGTVYSKHHISKVHPLFSSGFQMFAAAIILVFCSILLGETNQSIVLTQEAVLSIAYLVVFGSWIAFGSYMYVLKKLPASIVSTYAYINTAVGLLLGWYWLNEPMNIQTIFALLLTVLGVYLVSKSTQIGNVKQQTTDR